MKTVKEILNSKGYEIWSIGPDDTVFRALELMAKKNIGALVVLEETKVLGILSERDYARKVILQGKRSKEISIREIMTSPVCFVRPEQDIQECMALMTDKHIRHLPVIENNRLLGIISIGDVVKAIIAEHEFTISQLENYITGSR